MKAIKVAGEELDKVDSDLNFPRFAAFLAQKLSLGFVLVPAGKVLLPILPEEKLAGRSLKQNFSAETRRHEPVKIQSKQGFKSKF